MSAPLTVKVAPLNELFSGSYCFKLPWFQRAYAWQIQQVGRLLTNLFDGIEASPEKRYHMLGNLMLAQTGKGTDTAVVDGHQRILTITILFAVLRDLEPDPAHRAKMHARIASTPIGSGSRADSYHLQPEDSLKEFLDAVVQRPGATHTEPETYSTVLSETERNIIENRDYLRDELSADSVPIETRREIAHFLEESCHVVVRMADTKENAWHMLRIEEETRLDFNQAARAKASLISVMPRQDRGDAARVWDECQHLLGANDTYALLNHVRAMKLRKRSSTSLEADICQHFELDKSGRAFMENVFVPNAQRMASIRKGDLSQGTARESIARSTELMVWINPDQWMPAALHWMETRGDDDSATAQFFSHLERLVWVQKLAGIDPPRQETRINRLLSQIESGAAPDDMSELRIEPLLRKEALNSLRRVNFRRKHIAVNVLRRASVELGDDPHIFSDDYPPTVEHILPLSPPDASAWHKVFETLKQRKSYVNRLGNLTILTTRENQMAGNRDWSKKRQTLLDSTFSLSRAAAHYGEWTPKVIDKRTDDVIEILFKAWKLSI